MGGIMQGEVKQNIHEYLILLLRQPCKLKDEGLLRYNLSAAHWGAAKPAVNREYRIWKRSASGSVPGIADMNYDHRDYPSNIAAMCTPPAWEPPAEAAPAPMQDETYPKRTTGSSLCIIPPS